MIVTLGDLLLDVIVRLRQPLAEGADADAMTRLGPGGQAANVAAWVAELGGRGALRRQARATTRRAGSPRAGSSATASRCAAPSSTAGPAPSSRSSRDGRRADDGLGPRRLARAARRRARSGVARRLHAPPPPRLLAPALADRRRPRCAPPSSRRASRVDLSSWSAIRDFGPERFRERLETLGRRSCSRTRTRSGSSAGRSTAASGC